MNDQSPAVAGSPDTIRFECLGGGSARVMPIGVLQVLHEAGLRPSSGRHKPALIAALYATGLSPADGATALQIRRRTLLRSIPDFGRTKLRCSKAAG